MQYSDKIILHNSVFFYNFVFIIFRDMSNKYFFFNDYY